jgi:hypothetical protein
MVAVNFMHHTLEQLVRVHPKTPIFGFALSAVSIQLSAKGLQINQLADC